MKGVAISFISFDGGGVAISSKNSIFVCHFKNYAFRIFRKKTHALKPLPRTQQSLKEICCLHLSPQYKCTVISYLLSSSRGPLTAR